MLRQNLSCPLASIGTLRQNAREPMEPSRAQLDEPRCAVQMAAPHRLLAGRVQQHRRGLRGGMTARPIFHSPVRGLTSRASLLATSPAVASTPGSRVPRTVGSGLALSSSHPARLAAPGPEQVGRGHRSSEPPSGGLPPSQHLGYPDGGGLTSMCESRQLPTPRAPVRTLPPIFSLLRCCETAPTGRGARIFLP